MSGYSMAIVYKANRQKLTASLYTSNKKLELEI